MGDQRSQLTAIHEAGHAVADQRFGFTSLGCSIEPNDETLGRAHAYDDDFAFAARASDGVYEIPEQATRNRITALLAGYCAEIEAGGDETPAQLGAGQDFAQAAELRVIVWLAQVDAERAIVREEGRHLNRGKFVSSGADFLAGFKS